MSKITLGADDKSVEVEANVISAVSTTVSDLLAEDVEGGPPTVTIPGCTTQALDWICEHANGIDVLSKMPTDVVTDDFVSLLNSCNYLGISGLLDQLIIHARKMLLGSTPEEIRQTFEEQSDIPQETQDRLRKENGWIADPREMRQPLGSSSAASAAAASVADLDSSPSSE